MVLWLFNYYKNPFHYNVLGRARVIVGALVESKVGGGGAVSDGVDAGQDGRGFP